MAAREDTSKKTIADMQNEKDREISSGHNDGKSASEKKPKWNTEDTTGQTATTLQEMQERLKDVPQKSAATKHDKEEFNKGRKKK